MRINRQLGTALWRQITETLAEEIRSGRHAPGARFATETELADHFEVNRHTVRRAIRELVQEGALRVEHGKGTFVQGRSIDYPIGPRTRFTEIMLSKGIDPDRDFLQTTQTSASKHHAGLLDLPVGASLIRVETISSANGETFAYSIHFFPEARIPELPQLLDETHSITAALERLGFGDYRRHWTRIYAELPDARVAEALRRPMNRPVLKTESINVTVDGIPIEYGIANFAGDRCRLMVEDGTSS